VLCFANSWLSKYDAQPGLTQQSFDTIAMKVLSCDKGWAYKLCCLHIDEMEIKKHIDFDRHTGKVHGFTDIGNGPLDDPSQPQATKVLAVVAVGLAGFWKLPLGYYLTDGTNAQLQASVIIDVITKLWESGSLAVSITFDGLAANLKTVDLLGGNLDVNNMVSRFPHPTLPDSYVCVVLDACHMMKLMRNLLCEYQIVKIPNVGLAKWQHLENLHSKQQSEGLTLANRVTQRHVQYKLQKMKVRLAVQLLSSSVARALEYLRTSECSEFADTQPTEFLIAAVDRLFDILNSRSIASTGYKKPINKGNASYVLDVLRQTRTLLLSLEDSNGKLIVNTRRKTCIICFCATIDSVIYMTETYIIGDSCPNGVSLKYLLSYRLSQDHVETFFSVIRRRGGWNNNPTALQFTYAYRAMLDHLGVDPSINANVTIFDNDEYTLAEMIDDNSESESSTEPVFESLPKSVCNAMELSVLSTYVDDVCEYIAGYVVRRLITKLKCECCRNLLIELPESCIGGHFLELRNKGGLVKPSTDVTNVIRLAEKAFQAFSDVRYSSL
jgi:hypothetical protein